MIIGVHGCGDVTLDRGVRPRPAVVYTARGGAAYRIELRDPDGELLQFLSKWTRAEWRRPMNAPSSLVVEHPSGVDPDPWDSLVYPNELWVWRTDTGAREPVEKLRILVAEEASGGDPRVTVEAYSYLEQLSREGAVNYETGRDEEGALQAKRVDQIVLDLLGLQTQDDPILAGLMDSTIAATEVGWRFERGSVLAALRALRAVVGGYFSVDGRRRLHWLAQVGPGSGQWVRAGANMSGLVRRRDWRALRTRVVARGGAVDGAVLSATADDAAAQATYGVITGELGAGQTQDADTLEALAEAEVARRSSVAEEVRIDAVDLATAGTDWSMYGGVALPGARVRVISERPAVDQVVEVVEVVHADLREPERVELRVAAAAAEAGTGRDGLVEAVAALAGRVNEVAAVAVTDPEVIETVIETLEEEEADQHDELVDAINSIVEAAEAPDPSSSQGLDVTSAEGTTGTSLDYARADHTHQGMPWINAESALPSADNGAVGHLSGQGLSYLRLGGAWYQAVHFLGVVESLPAIPDDGFAMCYWTSAGDGDGDDQVWIAHANDSEWTPAQRLTTLSGEP